MSRILLYREIRHAQAWDIQGWPNISTLASPLKTAHYDLAIPMLLDFPASTLQALKINLQLQYTFMLKIFQVFVCVKTNKSHTLAVRLMLEKQKKRKYRNWTWKQHQSTNQTSFCAETVSFTVYNTENCNETQYRTRLPRC